MVPCGVPEVTLDQLDLVPLRITRFLRPVRKCQSQACKQFQQEPLVRNTVECLVQVKEN